MTEALLTDADRKEALSLAYVRALAAHAGYPTQVPNYDRDSVDLRIQAGGPWRPALDLQLKASTRLSEPRGGRFPFRISAKNYRDLRAPAQTPRLLVVLSLPRDDSRWLAATREGLLLRGRAYWHSMRWARHEIGDRRTATLYLSERNVLDVDVLHDLMRRSLEGRI